MDAPLRPLGRQQMHSCDTCRKRKVRCDSVDQAVCTPCRKGGLECRFTLGWKRPIRPKDRHNSQITRRKRHATVVNQEDLSDTPRTEEPHEGIENEVSTSQGLARTSLSQFFQEGVRSSTWEVFETADRMRIAYIGTRVSNLSHLIKLDQPSSQFLVYPHPEIRPSPPSRLYMQDPFRTGANGRLSESNTFLTEALRNDLIDSFFCKINPFFPVIEECKFRSQYKDSQSSRPLLLLYAILLAGAHVSLHPKIAESRFIIKSTLFARAKWLFDMRHENDRVHLVQAALLFTWHLDNADTVSMNSYYWSGVACRIGFGIGLHRDILSDPPDRMPPCDRREYRRAWWTMFQVEVMSALEHGRPPMIRLDDFDQRHLSLEDFREVNGIVNPALDFEYSSKNIQLCFIVLDLLRLSSPGSIMREPRLDLDSFHSRLASWAFDITSNADFPSLQLQLHYHCVVLHLFRLSEDTMDGPLNILNSTELCNGAARAILSVFETMIGTKVTNQCYSTSVMALNAAAIHLSKEIQGSITNGATLVALNLIRDLERIFPIATALSEFWPNAEGILKLFSGLRDKFRVLAASQQQSPTNQDDVNVIGLHDVNWEDILLYPSQRQSVEVDDWMNGWPGLDV